MIEPFQKEFAQVYDLLYSDKNYQLECDLIESAVQQFSTRKTTSILDAGCGSGGHTIELARRGYQLSGLDRSEGLLGVALSRSQSENLDVRFEKGDLRSFELGRKFDACISMFAVLSFLLGNDDLQGALKQIHAHLEPGGLLICDVWHGPAVLSQRPEKRLKVAAKDGRKLYRFAEPHLDVMQHTNEVKQNVLVVDENERRIIDEIVERQVVRFWFPQELIFHFNVAGFEVLRLFAFPDLEKPATEHHWELGLIARAQA